MVTNIWNKYLPVIKILLKRSKAGEQLLVINQSDFERVGLAKKAGNKFTLTFRSGKVENAVMPSPVAGELAFGLLHDESVKAILAEHDYRLTMDTKYKLHIEQLDTEENTEPVAEQLHHA